MARHVFIIVTPAPPEGQAEAFEQWYVGRHMPDVLAVPGFVSAQRFRLGPDPANPDAAPRSLTVYEIDAEDRDAVMAEVRRRSGSEVMPLFPGIDRGAPTIYLGEAVTGRIEPAAS